MCFAGYIVGALTAMAMKMPWQVKHLFWCVLGCGRIAAAAATAESGRLEYYMKVGCKRTNQEKSA